MRRVGLVLPLAFVGACSFTSKLSTSGLGTSSSSSSSSSGASSSDRQLTMPDLHGKTPDEALAALKAAGFDPRTLEENTTRYTCDYDVQPTYRLFTICGHQPAAGQTVSSRAMVRFTLERSQGDRGEIGTEFEYVLMPDVFGKPLDEATKILASVGLPVEKHFDVKVASPAERCEPELVCYTSPGRKLQKRLTTRGTITLGPKASPKPPLSPSKPAEPTQPSQPTQPTQPAQPDQPSGYF